MTDGVVLDPSGFSMTLAVEPSITATHEFVVPRSIPMTTPDLLEENRAKLKALKAVLIMISFIDLFIINLD